MSRPLIEPLDPAERLSPDDLATRRDAEQLASAMAAQAERAAKERSSPGVCLNCGQRCHPAAVYCDAECRADHEERQCRQRRTGQQCVQGGRP